MTRFSFPRRLPAALACLLAVSATAPQSLSLQIVDQRGLPVEAAVIEIAPPAGTSRPVAFPWRYAMGQHNLAFQPVR